MERYKILRTVGKGSFGVVFKALNIATGEVCAIKKMKKKFLSWDECLELREIKSLRKFSNSNVIKLKEVFRANDELYLVFEYMDQNIYEFIRDKTEVPEFQIRSIITQTLQGLVYIHKHGFFHRDLKPENLMITGNSLKITDFGLAREIRSKPPFTDYVSTRWYRAPEILLRSTSYNSPVDMFALGCIMAELYLLRPLAAGTNENDQMYKFCYIFGTPSMKTWPEGFKLASAMGYQFPSCEGVDLSKYIPNASFEAVQVLKALLQWDPQKRPTASECLDFGYFKPENERKIENGLRTESKKSHGSASNTGKSHKKKQTPENNDFPLKDPKKYYSKTENVSGISKTDFKNDQNLKNNPKDLYFPSIYNPRPPGNYLKDQEFRNIDNVGYERHKESLAKDHLPKFYMNYPSAHTNSHPKLPSTFGNLGNNILRKQFGLYK